MVASCLCLKNYFLAFLIGHVVYYSGKFPKLLFVWNNLYLSFSEGILCCVQYSWLYFFFPSVLSMYHLTSFWPIRLLLRRLLSSTLDLFYMLFVSLAAFRILYLSLHSEGFIIVCLGVFLCRLTLIGDL